MRHHLLVGLLSLAACSNARETTSESSSALDAELDDRVTFWESFAPICPDAGGFPSKEHCEDGDMTLFNGLLCASGDVRGCEAVRLSQDADGRWWRSPARVAGNRGHRNSFSRDMSMGVLLYLATTHDTNAAERWLEWIEDNRPCVVQFGSRCFVEGPHRMCRDDDDNRCTITPAMWAAMHDVWGALGLSTSDEMDQYSGFDIFNGELASLTSLGYTLHLAGVHAYLNQRLEHDDDGVAEVVADREPGNPFFAYLRDGASPEVRARVLEICPHPDNGTAFRKFQWSWERDTASEAWLESMGWDCIFMANLLR